MNVCVAESRSPGSPGEKRPEKLESEEEGEKRIESPKSEKEKEKKPEFPKPEEEEPREPPQTGRRSIGV